MGENPLQKYPQPMTVQRSQEQGGRCGKRTRRGTKHVQSCSAVPLHRTEPPRLHSDLSFDHQGCLNPSVPPPLSPFARQSETSFCRRRFPIVTVISLGGEEDIAKNNGGVQIQMRGDLSRNVRGSEGGGVRTRETRKENKKARTDGRTDGQS